MTRLIPVLVWCLASGLVVARGGGRQADPKLFVGEWDSIQVHAVGDFKGQRVAVKLSASLEGNQLRMVWNEYALVGTLNGSTYAFIIYRNGGHHGSGTFQFGDRSFAGTWKDDFAKSGTWSGTKVPSKRTGKPVAKLSTVSGTYTVSRPDGTPVDDFANFEQNLYADETIKVGPDSLVRIEFIDSPGGGDPTVVDITGNSEVNVRPFADAEAAALRRITEQQAQQWWIVNLVNGTLRHFTKTWKSASIFSVKAGTTVCGIRGTEFTAHYDSATDTAEFDLHEGAITLMSLDGRQRLDLSPGQHAQVVKGVLAPAQPLTSERWQQLLAPIRAAEPAPVSLSSLVGLWDSVQVHTVGGFKGQKIPVALSAAVQGTQLRLSWSEYSLVGTVSGNAYTFTIFRGAAHHGSGTLRFNGKSFSGIWKDDFGAAGTWTGTKK